MSLFHDLIDAALQAKCTQNELRVHLVLLRQTIGFGKSQDAISNRQLCDLSGVRSDRMQTAIEGLIEKGLWQRKKHRYYDYSYRIPEAHNPTQKIITPALPRSPDFQESTPPSSENASRNSGSHIQTKQTNQTTHTDVSCVTGLSESEQQLAKQLLKPLKPDDQNDCLKLFKLEFDLGKVKKPMAYLAALVKAAKRGLLDRSALRYQQYQQNRPTPPAQHIERANAYAERKHLENMAKLAGIPLEHLLKGGADHALAL